MGSVLVKRSARSTIISIPHIFNISYPDKKKLPFTQLTDRWFDTDVRGVVHGVAKQAPVASRVGVLGAIRFL